jgi:metal-responsive CopG/Arc/MetJ family transcriptional regulator
MAAGDPAQRRAKVSVTVDPSLLKAVDSYIQRHGGMDRSKVMDAALTRWCADRQEEAMREQFGASDPREEAERSQWKRIRRAAAGRKLRRSDD